MAWNKTSPATISRMRELRSQGLTNMEIAGELGCNRNTVGRLIGPSPNATRAQREGRLARQQEASDLRTEGLSNTRIAERMGVDVATVYRWIGSQPRDYHATAHPEAVYDEAVRLRVQEGMNNTEIARRTGVAATTIHRWMGPAPNEVRRAKDYSRTDLDRRAIYLRDCGRSVRELACELQVPRSTVGGWVRGHGPYGQAL